MGNFPLRVPKSVPYSCSLAKKWHWASISVKVDFLERWHSQDLLEAWSHSSQVWAPHKIAPVIGSLSIAVCPYNLHQPLQILFIAWNLFLNCLYLYFTPLFFCPSLLARTSNLPVRLLPFKTLSQQISMNILILAEVHCDLSPLPTEGPSNIGWVTVHETKNYTKYRKFQLKRTSKTMSTCSQIFNSFILQIS